MFRRVMIIIPLVDGIIFPAAKREESASTANRMCFFELRDFSNNFLPIVQKQPHAEAPLESRSESHFFHEISCKTPRRAAAVETQKGPIYFLRGNEPSRVNDVKDSRRRGDDERRGRRDLQSPGPRLVNYHSRTAPEVHEHGSVYALGIRGRTSSAKRAESNKDFDAFEREAHLLRHLLLKKGEKWKLLGGLTWSLLGNCKKRRLPLSLHSSSLQEGCLMRSACWGTRKRYEPG